MRKPCYIRLVLSSRHITSDLPSYRFESSDLSRLGRNIVHQHTTINLGAEGITKLVGSTELLDALVSPVLSLEVQVGSPVVGEVLAESAGSARCGARYIAGGHGGVEAVTADDLVLMGRGDGTGVDERVQTVNDHLGYGVSGCFREEGHLLRT
jgi:hypothetical protein